MSLQQFQLDVAAQVAAMPLAENVPVFVFRPREALTATAIQSKIDAALGALTGKNGLSGIAITVLMPRLDIKSGEQEMPGPYLHLRCQVLVQENAMVNMGINGTGIACEDLSISVAQALHLWTPGGVSGICRVSEQAIVPDLTYKDSITYRVSVESEPAFPDLATTPMPLIRLVGGQVNLLCLPVGVAIYYTLDGTTPAPSEGEIVTTAQLYEAPFGCPPPGTLLRAQAFLPGARGSDINYQQF